MSLTIQLPGRDDLVLNGTSFGAEQPIAGEIVFSTAMVGYVESITDPSFRGQILVLTFPLVGNYGVPDRSESNGLLNNFESSEIHISGLIVSQYTEKYSHHDAVESLGAWLKREKIPALFGVDTRMLTKLIRDNGSLMAKLDFGTNISFDNPNLKNLVAEVSTKKVTVYNEGGSPKILAIDCGMKYNIIRCFIARGVELTVVPFDHKVDLTGYEGLFISNGPGDPALLSTTISTIKQAMELKPVIPIFGICLGHQLLAVAAGASTYKMRFGNRGLNVPCIDMRTTQCVITSQNHGYAVDDATLPNGWKTCFMNANDHSNEGIVHDTEPWLGVQFHPEASAGPTDTEYLFDEFIHRTKKVNVVSRVTYTQPAVRKCLVLGSGGLSIGQAGEFDYSGSQALKALKEEGVYTILLNPNIATVQTQPNTKNNVSFADKVYSLPVTAWVTQDIIKRERPDSILISMGGQTALNVGIELFNRKVFEKYGVRVLGTSIEAIMKTEDRQLFAAELESLGFKSARSEAATTMERAVAIAEEIGYPVLVRSAFALGGLGSGFVNNQEELEQLCAKTLPRQVLIDEDLRGWKEVEYEVVRDIKDNCITVCNMENFDPLGIHTGDSIVISPSLTLNNKEYFMLREAALKIIRHFEIVGECNIQYALDPSSSRFYIIEVNARLSRSSALASKATGYPLAYVGAKLSLGKDLVLLRNSVTKKTSACFEPSLDYVVVKVPKWDLKKFKRVTSVLDSSMKSIGEVMAIGRGFEEALQKGLRMTGYTGFGPDEVSKEDVEALLDEPTPLRVFAIARAFREGLTVDEVHAKTKIDRFFLSKLFTLHETTSMLEKTKDKNLPNLLDLKRLGFSDLAIGLSIDQDEAFVRNKRIEQNMFPVVKQIDTLAGEFPASTNYLYTSYHGEEHDIAPGDEEQGVIVLGNGCYQIGSSVEFDWCAVSCLRTLRQNGVKSVILNNNPETVSTDYDESDRLYFEELSVERIVDLVHTSERAHLGVVISVGGQIANNMALPLSQLGVKILGTSGESIDRAEDREKFSALCDELNIDQPEWINSTSLENSVKFAKEVGFPVLVRPSYVLSGANMRVLSNEEELIRFYDQTESPTVVVSNFITNAKEVELDAVSQGGHIVNFAISEHIENAGTHSGDATLVLPAQKLYIKTINQIKRIAGNISRALAIDGPFNMQFICKDNKVKVIECNLRASRTFPFVSKTFDVNFISLATEIMLGKNITPRSIKLLDLDYCGIKAPMFSFNRLIGADPTLGVEMASTGEVACFGENQSEALLLAMMATGFKILKPGTFESAYDGRKAVLISVGPRKDKNDIVEFVLCLHKMGYVVFATKGTYKVLVDFLATEPGINPDNWLFEAQKPSEETEDGLKALFLLSQAFVEFAVIVPDSLNSQEVTNGYKMRRRAVDYNIPLMTNVQMAVELIKALEQVHEVACLSMEEMYKLGERSDQWSKLQQPVLKEIKSGRKPRGLSISHNVVMHIN